MKYRLTRKFKDSKSYNIYGDVKGSAIYSHTDTHSNKCRYVISIKFEIGSRTFFITDFYRINYININTDRNKIKQLIRYRINNLINKKW